MNARVRIRPPSDYDIFIKPKGSALGGERHENGDDDDDNVKLVVLNLGERCGKKVLHGGNTQ